VNVDLCGGLATFEFVNISSLQSTGSSADAEGPHDALCQS